MTVQQMHDWFDLIQDKVDSVYFTDGEKDQFINRAIQIFMNSLIHRFTGSPEAEEAVMNIAESDQTIAQMLKPVTKVDASVASDGSSVILDATIDTAFSSVTYLHILSLARSSDDEPVNFVRHNDFYKFSANEFKQPSTTKLYYRFSDTGLVISPTQASTTFKISAILKPTEVVGPSTTSTNLPDNTHDYIMAKALELAGIGSMDENLLKIRGAV